MSVLRSVIAQLRAGSASTIRSSVVEASRAAAAAITSTRTAATTMVLLSRDERVLNHSSHLSKNCGT